MKKNIIWVVVSLLLINLVILDIFLFKMNNSINKMSDTIKEQDNVIERLKKNTGYHEEVKLKKGQLLCTGTYSGKDKACPEGTTTPTECESEFEIKDDGQYSRIVKGENFGMDEVGEYKINKDTTLISSGLVDKSYEIHQAKDCSYIEVDGMKYNKVSEE